MELRRAGNRVNVGAVAERLGRYSFDLSFRNGGGLPYIAGAQYSDGKVSTSTICRRIAQIVEEILAEEMSYPPALEWVD